MTGMQALTIVTDGTVPGPGMTPGKYADRMPPDIHIVNSGEMAVVGMPEGTAEGSASVMVILDDGEKLAIGETTLRLFLAAADALRAKYAEELQ